MQFSYHVAYRKVLQHETVEDIVLLLRPERKTPGGARVGGCRGGRGGCVLGRGAFFEAAQTVFCRQEQCRQEQGFAAKRIGSSTGAFLKAVPTGGAA